MGMPPAASAGKNFSIRQPKSMACSASVGVATPGKKGKPNQETEGNQFKWDLEEEITNETLIVHNGTIRQNGKPN